jgi:hypothetical protein
VGTVSIYFQIGDDILWNPSSSVARIFKGEAEVIASDLRTASGLGEIINDECEVDLSVLQKFVAEAIGQLDRTNNSIFLSLTTGFVATATVLIERAGGQLPHSEQAAAWDQLRLEHARAMPR